MSKFSSEDRRTKRGSADRRLNDLSGGSGGYNEDVEFSDDLADQEDWEALERSERANARQEGKRKL
ncbi:YfhD family protein [Paenibacillus brevis]|uniref:YfhD family protein n=1 Tax=Paenibacillus brevis TaxID=2841508 RepID=A0ABS6FTB8_9BACL|nr:YfhD family protein [Paenibacillus brevis]MBU5672406.1 YfhD family protein [Paenibacillus brevis]